MIPNLLINTKRFFSFNKCGIIYLNNNEETQLVNQKIMRYLENSGFWIKILG